MPNDLVPSEFHLAQNYPNPFKERTTIKYCVPRKCRVVLTVQNSDGEVVERLVDDDKQAGTYETIWSAHGLVPGVYSCCMQAEGFSETKRMLVVTN